MTKPPCPNCGKTLTRHVLAVPRNGDAPDVHLEERWRFQKRIYCGRKCAKGHFYATHPGSTTFYETRRYNTAAIQDYLCDYRRLGEIPDACFTA